MAMTSYERIRAALLNQPVDHVPFCPFLAYVWEHYPKDIQDLGQLAFHKRIGADPLWRGAPPVAKFIPPAECTSQRTESGDTVRTITTTPVGTLSFTHQRSPQGNTWFLVEHPLKTPEDFRTQIWIERNARVEFDDTAAKEHLAGGGAEGLSVAGLTPRWKAPFQTLVEHHVGTEELAYALVDFPDVVEELLEAMAVHDVRAAEMACDSPYEFFLTWEDSSTQNYSPGQYQKYVAPVIRDWCDVLRAAGKHYIQHACGHLRDLIVPMAGQGNLGVESISPHPTGNISIAETRAIAGPDFAIIGGIEPTHFLRLEDGALDSYVESVLAAGRPGAFVLANSDSCPPGVTPQKFARAAEIARSTR